MRKYDIELKVISQTGTCVMHHRVGDTWHFGAASPAGLCLGAFTALAPFIRTLQFGGDYEWPAGSGTVKLSCPDPFNPVVFELVRVPVRRNQAPAQ